MVEDRDVELDELDTGAELRNDLCGEDHRRRQDNQTGDACATAPHEVTTVNHMRARTSPDPHVTCCSLASCGVELLGLRNLQALELLDDILAGSLGADFVVNVQDLAVRPDVERPARRKGMLGVDYAVGGCDFLFGIAEDGIVRLDMLGELLVRLGIVDAGSEIDDVGEGPDVVAALTERLALGRSATSERFREPGDDDRLPLVVGETMRLAVGSLEREGRRGVAGFEDGNERWWRL